MRIVPLSGALPEGVCVCGEGGEGVGGCVGRDEYLPRLADVLVLHVPAEHGDPVELLEGGDHKGVTFSGVGTHGLEMRVDETCCLWEVEMVWGCFFRIYLGS